MTIWGELSNPPSVSLVVRLAICSEMKVRGFGEGWIPSRIHLQGYHSAFRQTHHAIQGFDALVQLARMLKEG